MKKLITEFIQRDYRRTENDDYKINVERYIGKNEVSIPIYNELTNEIIGWIIKPKGE